MSADNEDTSGLSVIDGITHALKGKAKTNYKFKNFDSGVYYVHVTAYRKPEYTGNWSTTKKVVVK